MSEPNRTLRDLVRSIVPWWMQQTWGYGYFYSIAQLGDLLIQQAIESARLNFPSSSPDEALPYHGRDRGIRRGPAESRDSYVSRLLGWRTFAKKRGSAEAILRNVQDYFIGSPLGLPTVRLVTNKGTWFTIDPSSTISRVVSLPGPSNWDWDGHSESWDRFWIILYADECGFGDPPAPWDRDGTWGDGELWGNDGSSSWGSTASPDTVSAIRQRVADAQGDDQLCVSIIVSFDDTAFLPDGSGTLPDGLWGLHGKYDGSGNMVVARSTDAIYWDGTS